MSTSPAMKTAKIGPERRVAGHRLSARQPSVFGVSLCRAKLNTIQAGKISQVCGCADCSHHIYSATKAENASASKRFATEIIIGIRRQPGRAASRFQTYYDGRCLAGVCREHSWRKTRIG